jgi:Spy/CpxP family protein refolding chaperone
MMNPNLKKNLCGLAVALALGAAPLGAAQAQTGAAGVPCPMTGHGPGAGMGPGMMGMGGMGMMGGGMMDMMMGGGGMGMMGGGMMGMGPLGMLDLTAEQRAKINKLTDEHRRKDWDTLGKIMDEQAKLRDLYAADTPDPKKIGAVYGGIARYRQQMIEANVELQNAIEATLTREQREELKQMRRGGMPGMGMGMGRGQGPGGQRGMPGPGMMR